MPGVGSYSSNERLSSKVIRGPTFVIGRSARLKTDKPFGPGPDKYDATQNSFFVIISLHRQTNQKAIILRVKLDNVLGVKAQGQQSMSIITVATAYQKYSLPSTFHLA